MASLQGVGDVLVYETRRKSDTSIVEKGLKQIRERFDQLLKLKYDDPQFFEELFFDAEFLKRVRSGDMNVAMAFDLQPDRFMLPLSTLLNQFVRVHEAAIDSKNGEISKLAAYNISWMMREVCTGPANDRILQQLFRVQSDVSRKAVDARDDSRFSATVHWYSNVVFNWEDTRSPQFRLEYLSLCNKYLFARIQRIINNDDEELFRALVSTLTDGIHVPTYGSGLVWDYAHIPMHSNLNAYRELDNDREIEKIVAKLAETDSNLSSIQEIEAWLSEFERLKNLLSPIILEEDKQKLTELEGKIRSYVSSMFKFRQLITVLSAVGSYSLFKNRPSFIKILWEYKQPPDSDAIWTGHNLVPESLADAIAQYFRTPIRPLEFEFWEGHHGTEVYDTKYFLLTLMRLLQPVERQAYESIDFSKYSNHALYTMQTRADDLVVAAGNLKMDKHIMQVLFSPETATVVIDEKLVPFLQFLKSKSGESLDNLIVRTKTSEKKLAECGLQVVESLQLAHTFRFLLKHYGLITNDLLEGEQLHIYTVTRKEIVDKEALLENWHIDYSNFGRAFGELLALLDNYQFLKILRQHLQTVGSLEQLKEGITKAGDGNVILVYTNHGIITRFREDKDFEPSWKMKDKPDLPGNFDGYFVIDGKKHPLYHVHFGPDTKMAIVLNTRELGTLTRVRATNPGATHFWSKDDLGIQVHPLADNPDLLASTLERIPAEQRNAEELKLKKKVQMTLEQKFKFEPAQPMQGLILEITEKNQY